MSRNSLWGGLGVLLQYDWHRFSSVSAWCWSLYRPPRQSIKIQTKKKKSHKFLHNWEQEAFLVRFETEGRWKTLSVCVCFVCFWGTVQSAPPILTSQDEFSGKSAVSLLATPPSGPPCFWSQSPGKQQGHNTLQVFLFRFIITLLCVALNQYKTLFVPYTRLPLSCALVIA